MLKLSWAKCRGDVWCRLNQLDLSTVSGDGVYVIWCDHEMDGIDHMYVYVGQGSIRDRLQSHKANRRIASYAKYGTLYATWAAVSSQSRDGVERFLADELEPWEGKEHPDVPPIEVNLPFRKTE